jgi:hypothetical protein
MTKRLPAFEKFIQELRAGWALPVVRDYQNRNLRAPRRQVTRFVISTEGRNLSSIPRIRSA